MYIIVFFDTEDDKDSKKKKSKEAELPTKLALPAPTPLERWELSLMSCTSLSQLFVHLFTFGMYVFYCSNFKCVQQVNVNVITGCQLQIIV